MIGLTLLNRYQIEDELGKGGMGIVYKAHDTLLKRAVAIKFLNTAGVGTEGKARLLQEARAAARLNHPNIISVFDVGEADNSSFIVMELINGETLRKTEKSALSDSLIMARQICLALEHAHANGIIHRDLKLENIIITNMQTLKLMDFGLAHAADDVHLTEEGVITGTLAYLAPELIQGKPASVQSDLYAFGVILYELLTGHAPFQGTINTILAQHLHGVVIPPSEHNADIPEWVDKLVLRLLAKSPEERHASAKDVLRDIDERSTAPTFASIISIVPRPKNNLPTQLTTFIGREKEVEQIKGRMEKNRLVTLTGSGGIGKTRLSIQVASELLTEYPIGVWLVELAPLTDPALVPQSVCAALGVKPEGDTSALDALINYMHEKKILLVVDNCEHLIDACAQLCDSLLHACPDLRIIASSREALGIEGENAYRVPSLSLPNPKSGLQVIEESEAVMLFMERAATILPEFEMTEANAPAIAQICQRLDGIALAIELAASRVKMLKVEQIATRLDDAFRLLTGGSRTALPRQQTLRAMIDWSYNLLTEDEKAFLRRLSVFMGGWTLEAAEEVCENKEALELLTHLVDKSLVSVDLEHGDEPRYYLLETVRQYTREKMIESDEGEITREHHLEYYMRLAKANEARRKTAEQILAYKQMNVELDNFRLALSWSLGEDTNDHLCEKGLLLANFLDWAEISIEEGVSWLQKGLTLISDNDPKVDLTRAKTMTYLGWLLVSTSESQSAIDLLEKSLVIYQAHNPQDKSDWVNTFSNFAYAYLNSDLAKAHDYAQQGLILARSIGKAGYWDLGGALYWVGCVAYRQTEFETAKSNTLEGLAIAKQLGDNLFAAVFLQLLGWIEEMQENYDAARTYLSQVQVIYSNNDYSSGIKHVLRDIASLERLAGRYDEARKIFEETLALERDSGSKMGMVDNLWGLGETLIFLSEFEQATKTLRECLQLVHNTGDPSFKGYGLFSLAKVLKHYGRFHEAARLLGAIEVEATKDLWQIYAKRKADYDQSFEAIKNALGETEFASAYAEGKAMTLDQAISYVLELPL